MAEGPDHPLPGTLIRCYCLLMLMWALGGCIPTHAPAPPRIVRPTEQQTPVLVGINYSHTIGTPGTAPLEFLAPAGLAIDVQERLYVADAGNHRLQVLSRDGGFVAEYGNQGWRPGQFDTPMDVAIQDASLYIADAGNNRIQACFLTDWNFRVVAGADADADAALDTPHGVAVDAAGAIYIADTEHHRWMKLNVDGHLQFRLGAFGWQQEEFQYPTDIILDAEHHIFVVDSQNHRIQKFDFSGSFLRAWGMRGEGPGEFKHPTSLALDRWQRVYVVDAGNRRIQVFDTDGNFLTQGIHPSLISPSGIVVGRDGTIYVSDAEAGNIKVFQSVYRGSSETPQPPFSR